MPPFPHRDPIEMACTRLHHHVEKKETERIREWCKKFLGRATQAPEDVQGDAVRRRLRQGWTRAFAQAARADDVILLEVLWDNWLPSWRQAFPALLIAASLGQVHAVTWLASKTTAQGLPSVPEVMDESVVGLLAGYMDQETSQKVMAHWKKVGRTPPDELRARVEWWALHHLHAAATQTEETTRKRI